MQQLDGQPKSRMRPSVFKSCAYCSAEIQVKVSRLAEENFCNRTCYADHRRGKNRPGWSERAVTTTRNCPICDKEVIVRVSKIKDTKNSTCSPEHLKQYQQSLPHSWTVPIGSTKYLAKGYVSEKTDRGWIMQHRVVLERFLGRQLTRDENVHHLNGVRDDNRLDNLELWSTMQPSGKRVTDLINFAYEILARYETTPSHGVDQPKQ